MTTNWQQAAETKLGQQLRSKRSIGGGDFALSYQAELNNGTFVFIKTHQSPPVGFFSTEAQGLDWLRKSGAVNVPDVLAVCDEPPFLAMKFIELGSNTLAKENKFGEQLAHLHRKAFVHFGRPDERTTGSLALPNTPKSDWSEFYAQCRLLPLAKLAHERNALPSDCITALEVLSTKLCDFGAADEQASLLHGDLWAGNRVVDKQGESWLIDPAAHGGHREFDLAMMRLFGGFEQACFDAYQNVYPLQEGWQHRVSLHQLAPLVVHAIKFGGSYVEAVKAALAHYV